MDNIEIIHAGDSTVFCRLSEIIDPEVSQRVTDFHNYLCSGSIQGIIESVPSYTGLMIHYDPIRTGKDDITSRLHTAFKEIKTKTTKTASRLLRIPVCYHTEFSLDIDIIADHSGLKQNEVIDLHTSSNYMVYMIGFTPGFPYMGGLDKILATPRKDDPRIRINAGSVGIAGMQTGIYPIDSPGGWQIIGRTPLKLFDRNKSDHFLFRSGDRVSFYSISLKEYLTIEEQVRKGSFNLEIIESDERN